MPKTHVARTSGANSWISSMYDQNQTTGDVFYVNSASATGGDTTGFGFSPEAPHLSIAFAVSRCTPDNGDLVLVLPGHVETITGAAGVVMNKAGVTVRGLGTGRQRGKVNYTTSAAASFDITAARCSVANLTFSGVGVAAVTAMINVQAADVTFSACEFEHANATNQAAVVFLTTAAADRLRIEECRFHGSNNAGTNNAVTLVGGDSIAVVGNWFSGAYHGTQGVVRNITTDVTNLLIQGNVIQNLTAANSKAIVLTAASTGQINRNFLQVLGGVAPITGAAASWVGGNAYAAAVATAGTAI